MREWSTDVERTASCEGWVIVKCKPFNDSDAEVATEDFMSVDESDDEDDLIDI